MLLLPRSNPLYESIPAQKARLPEMLNKMGTGGFTGYLSYLGEKAEGYALFIKGVLISLLIQEEQRRKSGFEGIASLFEHTLTGTGHFSIYRMTPDLVTCTHALLHGDLLLAPQEVRAVDMKALLAQMKQQALNGTILFTAADRSAMIFYREGVPLGFYHDAAREIESSPVESQRVAAMPGAVIEIRSCQPTDNLLHHNLLEMVNIDKIWATAQERYADQNAGKSPSPPTDATSMDVNNEQLQEIIEDLKEIASAYLSRQGTDLVEQLLASGGGSHLLLDSEKTSTFLSTMATQSANIDPDAKLEEMVDLMRSEIAGRLSL